MNDKVNVVEVGLHEIPFLMYHKHITKSTLAHTLIQYISMHTSSSVPSSLDN